jgi:HD-like signal output (HDOD) protein
MTDNLSSDLAVNRLEESLKQAIVDGFVEVPMLPEVANRALSLAHDANASAADMAELIQRDQSLAGHVMRIANSVAYSPRANLVSLQQAVARLGMIVISEIALTAALSAKMFRTPGYEDYVEYNWQHALATSLWAKEVAKLCGSDVEMTFMTGLLHSIGRPAVLQTILDIAQQRNITTIPEEVYLLEKKYSRPVSELVVRRWNMPQEIIESIKDYEELDESTEHRKVAAAVYLSSRLATYLLDIAAEEDIELLIYLAKDLLELDEAAVEHLLFMEEDIQRRLDGLSA